jgi:hypothetical protein
MHDHHTAYCGFKNFGMIIETQKLGMVNCQVHYTSNYEYFISRLTKKFALF